MIAVILIVISFAMFIVAIKADQHARKNYIPREELMQKYAQPDKYAPWSHTKRMRYYDYEQRIHRRRLPSQRPYVSHIETGYIHRRI